MRQPAQALNRRTRPAHACPCSPTCLATARCRLRLAHLSLRLGGRPCPITRLPTTPTPRPPYSMGWPKLSTVCCWDESAALEWRGGASESALDSRKAHIRRIFEICVENVCKKPSRSLPARASAAWLPHATMCSISARTWHFCFSPPAPPLSL